MLSLRVAVAIAIIKNKPENVSSQDHTANLQRQFILKQSQLENDYERAKLKILNLEERLVESSIQNLQADDGTDRGTLQILTPPTSDNSQNKHCRNDVENGSCHQHEMVTLDIESSKFIQSIASLQNFTTYETGFKREELRNSAVESIANLSKGLSRRVIALSETCLCKAVNVITSLFQRFPWLEDCDDIMEGVCRLMEMVLSRVKEPSNCRQFPPHRQKHSLMQMLVAFLKKSSAHLSVIVLDGVMESWEDFCQGLRDSRRTGIPLDPVAFDSSFFIIHAIELAMKSWLDGCSLGPDLLHDVQERLENSLLHLTDYFPLVSQAVWKVTVIIETILQDCPNGL